MKLANANADAMVPIANLPIGYPMVLVVDANIRIKLSDIDFEELLAEGKNDRQKDRQIRLA